MNEQQIAYEERVSRGAQILANIIDARGLGKMFIVLNGGLPQMFACVHSFWEAEQYRQLRGDHYREIVGIDHA